MKIFIANLPYKIDEAELKTMLTQYGQVASVKLLTDKETGKRKGFGFIEMPVDDQGKKAIEGLNGKEIYGRKIALSEAEDNKPPFREHRQGRANFSRNDYERPDREIDGNRWP